MRAGFVWSIGVFDVGMVELCFEQWWGLCVERIVMSSAYVISLICGDCGVGISEV